MEMKGVAQSERRWDRTAVGVLPMVVTAIQTRGASGPLVTFGLAQGVALLSALALTRVYLFVTWARAESRDVSVDR